MRRFDSLLKRKLSRLFHLSFTFVGVFLLVIPLSTGAVYSAQVTLAWDAHSASDQVTSYSIHYKTGSSGPPYDGQGASQGDSPIVVSVEALSDPDDPQYAIYGLSDNETYYLAIKAYNAYTQSGYSDEVSTTTGGVNWPPVLGAIGSKSVDEGDLLTFTVTASDPDGDGLTFSASNVPTGASFNPSTRVFSWTPAFGASGNYNVTFTVTDDGTPAASDSETVTITVSPVVVNNPPVAVDDDTYSVGIDTTLTESSPGVLENDTDSDGDPLTATLVTDASSGILNLNSDGSFTYTPNPGFTGTDSFTCVANDGTYDSNVATVTITVGKVISTFKVRVAAGSDDAEELASGYVETGSSDLELVYDAGYQGDQTIGIRFNGVDIPQGATIVNAYVQFQVDEVSSVATSLVIVGEDTDNAPTFTSSAWNISDRARTAASVAWSPEPWTTIGEAGPDQRTPDIASVVQEIVDGSGWSSGNSLAVIITGTGKRVAESYNGNRAGVPLLYVEYTTGSEPPSPVNQAPSVHAGSDQNITFPEDSVSLNATVTDDGLPDPPCAVTTTWSQVSGPSVVIFDDASAVDTTASLSEAGTYVFQLEANDGELTASDEITVVVRDTGGVITAVEVRVAAGSDDAEELASGYVETGSSDLELVYDAGYQGDQTIGIRFNGVDIPQGATIVNAYVQFQVDEVSSVATSLVIVGEDTDNAPTFTSSAWNISDRARTAASVAWSPEPWTTIGEAGPDQRTPDIASVVQEIVDGSGWSSGNSLAVIITGTGKRVAESYNGNRAGVPLLYVEYTTGSEPPSPVNQAPSVHAGSDQNITFPEDSVSLNATVTDDGLPDPPCAVTTTWSQVSGPSVVIFDDASAVDTTASLSEAGTYVFQLEANDGELTASDEITVVVRDTGGVITAVEVRVAAGSDDAEELASGYVETGSSDLELVYDAGYQGDQTIGIRFNGVDIPQGATIVNAYVQFQVDEVSSVATSLVIVGEDTDNAPTFTSSAWNISDRARTAASVAWSPEPWTTIGEAGPDQRTPDIASVVQEIVDGSGWSSGNSLAVIITGTGKRVAESYNGNRAGVPLLYVEYTTGSEPPSPVNQAPSVHAGSDQNITFPEDSVSLNATVTDDGLPDPPCAVTTTWSQVSGPSVVIFDDASAVDTTASLSEAGTYVFQLEANDGELTASDEITVVVRDTGGVITAVEVRVAAGSDDAEELASGYVETGSSDLELVYDAGYQGDQTIGIRFNGVDIPQGATIVNAYVQFQVDEVSSVATSLVIVGEDTDNAPTFTSSAWNISDRARTAASVAWSPEPWTTIGEAGPDQRTPDIASVVQEIVDGSGWSSGNSLAVIITGTGKRVAESYNGNRAGVPLLYVEYNSGE